MDFEFGDRQTDPLQRVQGNWRICANCDAKEECTRGLVKKAAELGFIGAFIKKEYGGLGLGFLEHAIILEEFWRIDPGLGHELCSVTFGAEELLLFGSEEQKKRYLPPLTKGDWIMGFSITEPEAGSEHPQS
jgi:alkylation response protein AidB-like acyl-CoA dehydrogenase